MLARRCAWTVKPLGCQASALARRPEELDQAVVAPQPDAFSILNEIATQRAGDRVG
jgi:hypothetical protein